AAIGERGQFGHGLGVDVDHGQVVAAAQSSADLVPPQVRGAAVVVQHHDLGGTSTGLADTGLVGLADIDPQVDVAAQRLQPQVRLVGAGGATRELQAFACVQGESQEAHHQA